MASQVLAALVIILGSAFAGPPLAGSPLTGLPLAGSPLAGLPIAGSPQLLVQPSICVAPGPLLFYNLAETERAASTGSIKHKGKVFAQFYHDHCPNIFSQRFRSIDGTCNNALNLGAAFTPPRRILPAAYDDGVENPRQTAVNGRPLPSARAVSIAAHPATRSRRGLTNMVMQWGQFLDHDMTAFPIITEIDHTITCCGPNHTHPPFHRNKHCFPIELPVNENNFRGTCMEFARSIAATDSKGKAHYPREQINSLTSFIDGSQIYGSSSDRLEMVREPFSYLLKTKGRDFLPKSEDEEEGCILRPNSNDYCFLAGDSRVNEQPGLGSMHTLWMREHNRIARALSRLRPLSSAEEIFQITRKIVGALLQKITYNDWLPRILGKAAFRGQLVSKMGRSIPDVAGDPRISNSFATATFRFGHSMIPSTFLIGRRSVQLRDLFNRPAEVLENMDDVLAGLAGVSREDGVLDSNDRLLEDVDRNIVEDVTKFLFQPPDAPRGSGFDLVALNIQRGRDHGLPPYTKFRNFCGLRPLTGFNDVEALGPFVAELGNVYESVDDIDLFTGLLHEPATNDTGIVGPTLACLLVTQFSHLKSGDRFFFDTSKEEFGFTDDQLANIRETTLASVMCENLRIPQLPENVFIQASNKNNKLVNCRKLKGTLDLRLFRE